MFTTSATTLQDARRQAGCRKDQAGMSLIEVIVFVVIVGVALAGVLSTLNLTTARSADPLIRKQMLAIAEGLMDEIQLRPFTFCKGSDVRVALATSATVGGAGCSVNVQGFGNDGEARANFTNLTNYCGNAPSNSITCSSRTLGTANDDASIVQDLSGIGASPPGYWATITLAADNGLGPAGNKIASANPASGVDATALNAIRITVTVASTKTTEVITLNSYRTRWAGNIP
jgi:MSHA pilin protein MshD